MCGQEAGASWDKLAFSGRLLRVVVRQTPRGVYELVEHPGAVAILVTNKEGKILLVRQHREGVSGDLWEIPAGTLQPEETPYSCAERELLEETGLEGKLQFLGVIYPTPGYSTERIFLFSFAENFSLPQARSEIEEVRFFTIAEILELARQGKGDGKTLAALAFLLGKSG